MAGDLERIIETAVREALLRVSVESVAVEHRRDSADEEALYVVVTLPTGTPSVGGRRYIGAMTAVSDALIAIGEQRFPYVRLNRAGEEMADESDRPEASVR